MLGSHHTSLQVARCHSKVSKNVLLARYLVAVGGKLVSRSPVRRSGGVQAGASEGLVWGRLYIQNLQVTEVGT